LAPALVACDAKQVACTRGAVQARMCVKGAVVTFNCAIAHSGFALQYDLISCFEKRGGPDSSRNSGTPAQKR